MWRCVALLGRKNLLHTVKHVPHLAKAKHIQATLQEILYTNPIPGLDLDMINFYDFKIHYGGAQCTVFWDAEVNDERRQHYQRILDAYSPQLQYHITDLVRLRRSPKLQFKFDKGRAKDRRIWDALRRIHDQKKKEEEGNAGGTENASS
uniref:Ribosome-binding factor A n=1 Tax=Eutreptiella gymnastica TaxID=73025 RepID=A0A7S4CSF3_9EUGL